MVVVVLEYDALVFSATREENYLIKYLSTLNRSCSQSLPCLPTPFFRLFLPSRPSDADVWVV